MQPERGLSPGRPPVLLPPHTIRADRSWIGAGALLAAHLAFSVFGDRTLATSILLGIAGAFALFVCVVLHALAHAATAALTGTRSGPIRLYVFGDVEDGHRTLPVALAGPVSSGLLGALLLTVGPSAGGAAADISLASAWACLGLAAINLLPGLPLDGGHVLAALTHRRRLAVRTGQLFGIASIAAGMWIVISSPGALDGTAFGLWLLLAGVFILTEAQAANQVVPRMAFDGEVAGSWARPFVGRLTATDPVPSEGGPYAVSDGTRLAGVLPSGSPELANQTCGDVMVPWVSGLGIRTSTPLRDALTKLVEERSPVVVVVDEKGIVRGVLDEAAARARIGAL